MHMLISSALLVWMVISLYIIDSYIRMILYFSPSPLIWATFYLINFYAIVSHAGELYELDGRKSGPISHGPSSPSTLLRVNILHRL